jgi:hypothetical protein
MKQFFKKLSHWESWPFRLIYAPLSIYWIKYIIKSRHIWWFVPVNPTLEFAGFEGETKTEMYEQLPDWSIPTTLFVEPTYSFDKVLQLLKDNNLQYPIITKPNRGMQGVLFRILENDDAFKKYHEALKETYIVQPFVDYPVEISLFHVRYPHEEKGTITGFILKEYMHVKGDGVTTIGNLVKQHPKAQFMMEEMERKHGQNFENILPSGEKYLLSYAGNHNRGARFINLKDEINEQLLDTFAKISKHAGTFYYGRYDIKCASIEDLKQGKNFAILEYNGAGAEPNHIYDCGMSLKEAYKVIIKHWDDMYKIARINYKNGTPYWGAMKGWRFLTDGKKHFKELKAIDLDLKL